MRRIKDYADALAWQTGLAYLALWLVAFWAVADGAAVFGRWGCSAEGAGVSFWACEANAPMALVARFANTALAVTIGAPVLVGRPEAPMLLGPVLALHALGAPAAFFAAARMARSIFASLLQARGRGDEEETTASLHALELIASRRSTPPRPVVEPRDSFGLRGPARQSAPRADAPRSQITGRAKNI
jgi:hypothetical protein